MARILSSWATSGTSSTSSLTNLAVGKSSENLWTFVSHDEHAADLQMCLLGDLWCDDLARSTPCCVGIEDDDLVLFDDFVEVFLAVWGDRLVDVPKQHGTICRRGMPMAYQEGDALSNVVNTHLCGCGLEGSDKVQVQVLGIDIC